MTGVERRFPKSGDPLADTTERFLTALLTGNGEFARRRFVNSDDGFIEMLDAVRDYPNRV